MKWLLVVLISFASPQAFAALLKISIYEIDESDSREVMVKTDGGEVLWVKPENIDIVQLLKEASLEKFFVQVETDEDNFIFSALKVAAKSSDGEYEWELAPNKLKYTPTVFTSVQSLKDAFLTMRRDSRRKSQCYDRAYVWGYDLWEKRAVNSMKLFLFFTNKYIREYRYKWWFHVSPMSYVDEQEYVIDRLFTKGPLTPQRWTNIFMRNNAVCKTVESYFDYFKDDPTESCFLIRATMYYLGPNALKRRDQGYELTEWNTRTLRSSRRRGFY